MLIKKICLAAALGELTFLVGKQAPEHESCETGRSDIFYTLSKQGE